MTTRKRNWILIVATTVVVAGVAGVLLAAKAMRERVEPYVREQAIKYLSERFDADVQIANLHVGLPPVSKLKLWFTKGKGVIASVAADGIVLRQRATPDIPPLFSLRAISFQIDLGTIFGPMREIPLITVQGMEIHVPPKGQRPKLSASKSSKPEPAAEEDSHEEQKDVAIDQMDVTDTLLVIHPVDPKKKPLEFNIQKLRLHTEGFRKPLEYQASLTNPKPPGQIESTGTFGPWVTGDPGASPLQGKFTFSHADLGVFKAIAGILESTGSFQGELAHVQATGEARVPDFRLKNAGNPMALTTQYEVEVDGRNGNTILKPVHALLGNSRFVTSGAVIKHDGDPRRTIDLKVNMTSARLEDFLRLAMKGPAFMEGSLDLQSSIGIPPLSGPVVEKLKLNGMFSVKDAKFLKSKIQDKIDELSRKGQGEPKNEGIDEVVSQMAGAFSLENQMMSFSRLEFGVPGADIDLTGSYDLDEELLDFHGAIRLVAKLSQTQTGIKRLALKAVDPFFDKDGAGTLLHIKVTGPRSMPSFGLDHL